ncbi:MAG: phospholipase D-like domain-containing protein [Candidatus Pacearchaeota archaeon]|nr:phospholipase D-like domain-containing protein [Candidatus Pacearchaeota archaeon]
MITNSNKDQIYIGRQAGKEIHETIKNAKKSVKIVSPYLSANYIKDLITLHKKGVKVTLITCDKIESNSYSDFSVSDLIKTEKVYDEKKEKLKKNISKISIFLFGVSLISLIFSFTNLIPGFISTLLLSISVLTLLSYFLISPYSHKSEPIFRIKVFDSHSGKNPGSTELIHSKIFIIDEEIAFLGSVNLTYSGFKTHYETAIKVEDKSAVSTISQEVERLYSSKDLKAKSVEEWTD